MIITVQNPKLSFILNSKWLTKHFLSFSSRPSNFMLEITLTIKRPINQITKSCQNFQKCVKKEMAQFLMFLRLESTNFCVNLKNKSA